MTSAPRLSYIALKALPVFLVAGGFLASAEWLKATLGSTAVTIIGATAAFLVMVYAIYLSARVQRGMDEVQRASAGFAAKWGPSLGHIAFVLLLVLPPVQAALTGLVADIAADPGETVDRTVVTFSLTLGFMAVVLLQLLGTVVMNAVWWARKR